MNKTQCVLQLLDTVCLSSWQGSYSRDVASKGVAVLAGEYCTVPSLPVLWVEEGETRGGRQASMSSLGGAGWALGSDDRPGSSRYCLYYSVQYKYVLYHPLLEQYHICIKIRDEGGVERTSSGTKAVRHRLPCNPFPLLRRRSSITDCDASHTDRNCRPQYKTSTVKPLSKVGGNRCSGINATSWEKRSVPVWFVTWD